VYGDGNGSLNTARVGTKLSKKTAEAVFLLAFAIVRKHLHKLISSHSSTSEAIHWSEQNQQFIDRRVAVLLA
jgi:hypothetical protein